MDPLNGTFSMMPAVAAIEPPAWFQALDGVNLVIGFLTLVAGLLGIAYLALTFVATPQPATAEAGESSAYPAIDRLIVPLFLPIGVSLVIAAVIVLLSQILLVVPESISTPIALVVALVILLTCAAIATMPRVSRGMIYTAIGVPALILLIAGGAAGTYRFNKAQEEAAAQAEREANTPATAVSEVTTDNKFSRTSLIVPSGQEITFTLDNKGVATHNWHVLEVKDGSGKDITTDLTQPGQTSKVAFTLSSAGKYKFQCDVHPTEMVGTLTVQ